MSHYDENSIPDDPYRVAPPFCAPGEVEPPDAPQVSDKEATDRVIDVLLSFDPESRAFGESADDWIELLADFFADSRYRRFAYATFASILDASKPNLLPILRRSMEAFIGDHANNWLAEADNDELEREGFGV